MHIADGVLSPGILGAGIAVTALGTGLGLKKLKHEQLPQTAVLASVFFTASLIHVPVGPSSSHLILNGLVGVVLGWTAFPVILISLLLQAIFFGFGGIIVLGVNTMNMAIPAVICHYLFADVLKNNYIRSWQIGIGFLIGFLSIFISGLMTSLSLALSNEKFFTVAALVFSANLPVMLAEGVITSFIIVFLKKARPEILQLQPVEIGN